MRLGERVSFGELIQSAHPPIPVGTGPALRLVCGKCTRQQAISAPDKETAVLIAKARGWRALMPDETHEAPRFVCPRCP